MSQYLTAARERLLGAAPRELKNTRSLTIAAVLAALHLVLNLFTIPVSQFLEIGFDFLTVAATGFLCGPWVAGLTGIVTDIVGYMLRPNGPFFPGWTLSAILLGIVYGLFYYKKKVSLPRIICCQAVVVVVFNFFLTPLWLHLLYGKAFVILSSMRLVKNLVQFPVNVALTWFVLRTAEKLRKN